MTALTDTNAATGNYDFDGAGNRVVASAVPGGSSVRMVYDGPNAVLDLENGVVKAAYVHGLGIDQPIERIQFIGGVADGRHVYHTDALGSVWAMTDDLQVVAQAYTYETFGKLRSETGTGLLFPNRYTYTAREALGDSLGLMYYRWRVMDPNVGRFTSEDPWLFIDGANLYRYVKNDPLLAKAPFGRSTYFPPQSGSTADKAFCNLCRILPGGKEAMYAAWCQGNKTRCDAWCGTESDQPELCQADCAVRWPICIARGCALKF
jgi:RHS repeat-associated protein